MKTIHISLSNDLYSDNRVLKTCKTLVDYGMNAVVICKKTQNTTPKVRTKRISFLFKKNVMYYAELNIKLFFTLLFHKQDVLWANDLDTLPANFLVSRLKHIPLIYDSHEMFCFVPELKQGSIQQKVWLAIEKRIVPKLRYVITVCDPIKDYFKSNYNIDAFIVRNIPPFDQNNQVKKSFPLSEKYLIWQGAANIDRGLEELVTAMQYVNIPLFILGKGDVICDLQQMIHQFHLENKVFLCGRKPFDEMMKLTVGATLGISIDKPTNKNYEISLPNKIFEYINAATPVLYSELPEIRKIENHYNTGTAIEDYSPDKLAKQINAIVNNNDMLQQMSDNCLTAQRELNWQNEEKIIINLLNNIVG